ncbi:pyridoxamine 5'-phosphate oxidase family protein [Planctomycetota bacterium]
MTLKEYFTDTDGLGVLATADGSGRVNTAIYARPHVVDENTVAFIMAERLTHANLDTNPHASFLFKEAGEGYQGKRLHLSKMWEEKDSDLLHEIRRSPACEVEQGRYLVFFNVDKVLPLVGAGVEESAAEVAHA